MSLRTRELLNIFVVGLLTAAGFASVYIARQEVVSAASLSYAVLFLVLYVVAHAVARIATPYADPYLLPMVALLTAIGLTVIYRLNPDDAFRQGLWIVVGVAAFSGALVVFRSDYRILESYKYVFGIGAIVLLALPAAPTRPSSCAITEKMKSVFANGISVSPAVVVNVPRPSPVPQKPPLAIE